MMWQTQTTIEYPFALRPASIEEAGLFYSQMDEAEDAVLGTVGHIRMDFGASGKEFYHTWWPHNGDQFNTGEFKEVCRYAPGGWPPYESGFDEKLLLPARR